MKEIVERLVSEALEEREDLFLVDLHITPSNQIRVAIDGDKGVNLDDCVLISRAVEHNLDRESNDFSLEVSSVSVTDPIKLQRQYNKNIGRKLKVITIEGDKFEGSLTEIKESGIVLEWKAREPKPIGKGKRTVEKVQEINFDNIKEAKSVITF